MYANTPVVGHTFPQWMLGSKIYASSAFHFEDFSIFTSIVVEADGVAVTKKHDIIMCCSYAASRYLKVVNMQFVQIFKIKK